MNKKIILPMAILLLIGIIGFVLADYDEADVYSTTITLEKGWNLVSIFAFPDAFLSPLAEWNKKRLDEKGLGGIFIYDKYLGGYIRIYPNREEEKVNQFIKRLNVDDSQKWAWSAASMWVYSNKKQEVTYSTNDGPAPINLITLNSGWNFLGITPQMVGKNLNEIKGNCNIEKAFGWESNRNNWNDLLDEHLPKEALGAGFIIKVSENCKLGTSTGEVPPVPNLP